jgi:5-methylthioadenosine/S-adenosylhomocysteine deaminase
MLADMVLLRLDTSFFTPLNDTFRQLVYCENGSSVETVLVDGQIVVEGGRLLTADQESAMAEAREWWAEKRAAIPPLEGNNLKIFRAMERFQAQQSAREFHPSRH